MPKKTIKNLQFGVGFSLAVLIASSVSSYLSIQKQIDNREIVLKSRRTIGAVKDITIILLNAETGNRGFQLTGKNEFLQPYNNALVELPKSIERAKTLELKDQIQLSRLQNIEKCINAEISMLSQYITAKKSGRQMSLNQMYNSKKEIDKCRELVREFVKYEEARLDAESKDLNSSSSTTVLFIICSALAATIVSIIFYIQMKNDLIRREKLERQLRAKDEEIANRVSAIQEIAHQVANGDYSKRVSDETGDNLGDLAESLNHMTESLQNSFDKIRKSDWLQKGLAFLNESLVGNKAVKDVTNDSLKHLIEYGNCINGAVYLLEEGHLKLSASYGLEDTMKKSFAPGDGMIGQAFLDKKIKIFRDLSDNDYAASFASQKIKISTLILIPILNGRQTLGVLELSSLDSVDGNFLEYFSESSRIIGVALAAARGREKEQRLLEETQAQSEELQVQHSELENLNSELEAQAQKLQASEEELKVQQEELMQINAELEERSKLLEEKNHLVAERNIEIQKKAEELALSTQYKSEFLANMSHELRTPLNSILLLSRLMAENTEDNLTEDQIESAKVIQSSGTSLLTLIDEILDLAKIESGKMTLEYEEIAIADVVNDVNKLFLPMMKDKGLDFNITVDPQLETSISTDRLRIDQVFRNLLSNALKFTKTGSISFAVKNDPKNRQNIMFSVKDTGIGIPQDKQKIIFEAFQQADGSTQRKFGGTGLGLSISREIAKLLGGELLLESKMNEGSIFTLVIPKTPGAKTNPEPQAEDALAVIQKDVEEIKNIVEYEEGNFETNILDLKIPNNIPDDRDTLQKGDRVILIVEDDVNFAKALIKYAHRQQYKAIAVVRGDDALAAAVQYRPLAILLDVQLPVKDGWMVMDELKKNPETKNIPVHMMSSLHVKKESMMRGAIDFINKPVALAQMSGVFKKIEEALKKSPQKVLIVEENAKHASALSYFLSSFNINLSIQDDVESSVKALRDEETNCVILDISSFRGKEFEIIESIKSHDGLENLPIIIFTAQSLSTEEELRIKKYADSIVVKTAHSYQRILDEVGLFLHLVEEKNNVPDSSAPKNLGSLTEVLSGKKILITDDDVRNIFSLTKALEKYKVEVVLAIDGKQALTQIENHPDIDVVLMDMMMPEMDGYETIREIRKMPGYSKLPIIAVTAKSMRGDREKCITAGASDYISKPVDIDQLLSLLRVWLYEI